MKLKNPVPITEIAQFIGAELIGDETILVHHLSEIHKVQRGSLMFVGDDKYLTQAIYSSAVAIIVNKPVECPEGKALLVVEDPFESYNSLALYYSPTVHLNGAISKTAKIGKNVIIEPGVVIGNEVTIGDDCWIRANTVICDHTKIGNRVIIHPNTTIGSDAFYFQRKPNRSYKRWHSIGRVIIEDDVEIGAGCTIDKGVSGDTIIGNGTKLDNLIHIGHGVEIGKNCILAAQVGIAGKTKVQDNVTIYGQAGLSKSIVIGEDATILAQAGVTKSLPGGKTYVGAPAAAKETVFREFIATRQLPKLYERIDELEHLVKSFEKIFQQQGIMIPPVTKGPKPMPTPEEE